MSSSLPLTWLWDCRPLAADAWGNVQGFCDYIGTERRILIRQWIDRRPSAIANPLPRYRPAYTPLPPFFTDGGARWCYVPTEADITRVRKLLPDCPTPEHPPWDDVGARLVAAGHSPSDLAAMHPVALLTLLESAAAARTPAATAPGPTGGEGKAGAVTRESDPNRYAALDKLTLACRQAYFAFLYAEAKKERRLEDREAYDWIREYGIDESDTFAELANYTPPAFDTWARYLRKARKATNERKYRPRYGQALGRSVVRKDEIEYQEPDDS